jgi:hypothetical protein
MHVVQQGENESHKIHHGKLAQRQDDAEPPNQSVGFVIRKYRRFIIWIGIPGMS